MAFIKMFRGTGDKELEEQVNTWFVQYPRAEVITMVQNVIGDDPKRTEKHVTFLWRERQDSSSFSDKGAGVVSERWGSDHSMPLLCPSCGQNVALETGALSLKLTGESYREDDVRDLKNSVQRCRCGLCNIQLDVITFGDGSGTFALRTV